MGIFSIGLASAQVGINTTNPQGIFHIDPRGDTNGSTNITDDVIITNDGNLGIGTITPKAKLHINTGGTPSLPIPGLVIADGTQKARRILSTNAVGRASWKDHVNAAVLGVLGAGVSMPNPGVGQVSNWYNTGSSITLPPGKWIIHIFMLAETDTQLGPAKYRNEFCWLMASFSDTPVTPLTPSSSIKGNLQIAGLVSKISLNNAIFGTITIEHTVASGKTFYFISQISNQNSGIGSVGVTLFGGNYGLENIIYALSV